MKKSELKQMIREELSIIIERESNPGKENMIRGLNKVSYELDDRVVGFMESALAASDNRMAGLDVKKYVKLASSNINDAIRAANKL